ncbi:MAG: hypothetical protein MUF43_08980 [Flavobacterium sp.]|nr:hypothetical protein [Flavobacterium sp.]
MNWCIRKTINTKSIAQNKVFLLFLFFFLFASSFQVAFTQGSHINCVITDGDNQTMEADYLFPDWYKEAYHNVFIKKKDYGNDIVLSMDFIINNTQFNNSNNYTDNTFTGVENISMLEFSRIDIAYKLINTKECNLTGITGDTISIRILQKTPCYKFRFCSIPIDSIDTLDCCNMYNGETGWGPVDYTTKPGFEFLPQGRPGVDQNGNRVVFVNAGRYECGYKCCEIKYKFLCKTVNPENPITATIMWSLVGVEKKEFENSTCHEYYHPGNPNCPLPLYFNNINPCKGDCNETHY